MSRRRREETNILSDIVKNTVASGIPWWAAFIAAFLFYIIFDFISEIKVDGGLIKHPVWFVLIILSNICKIMFPAAFVIGGVVLAFKQLFGKAEQNEAVSNESIPKPVRSVQPAQAASKISSSKLAKKLGISTSEFLDRMVEKGCLEVRGGKRHLTVLGKEIGGEFRNSAKFGPYYIWPEDLKV